MRVLESGIRGLSVFLAVNADRMLCTSAIAGMLFLAAWVQSA